LTWFGTIDPLSMVPNLCRLGVVSGEPRRTRLTQYVGGGPKRLVFKSGLKGAVEPTPAPVVQHGELG